MTWKRFRLTINADAENLVSSMLADYSVNGVQIEDHEPLSESEQGQMFADVPPEEATSAAGNDKLGEGLARITFYLDPDADEEDTMQSIRRELEEISQQVDLGPCTIEESETEDEDWVNNWKQYFHQFWVDDILITPSWEEPDTKQKQPRLIIYMDPGTAFGTGTHETTQLCIRGIEKYLQHGQQVLDVGCGSGILSMIALKLGAEHVIGTDLDSSAIVATQQNMDRNGLDPEQYEVILGNLADDPKIQEQVGYEKYDLVLCNILADVLITLTPAIKKCMKTGGIYITSGIIDTKEDEVRKSLEEAGLTVLETNSQGEWVSIVARKDK